MQSAAGSTSESGDLSAMLRDIDIPDCEDDKDVAAVLAADDDEEDRDALLFGTPSSRGKMKANWGLDFYGDEGTGRENLVGEDGEGQIEMDTAVALTASS